MSGHRAQRVADVVREALADVVARELRDPRVGFVTITGVKLSPDLRDARVFVSSLGDDDRCAAAVEALNHASPFLRKSLSGRVRLRYTPRLRFLEDPAVSRGARVEELLREIHRDDPPPEPGRDGE